MEANMDFPQSTFLKNQKEAQYELWNTEVYYRQG